MMFIYILEFSCWIKKKVAHLANLPGILFYYYQLSACFGFLYLTL
jgi:hypothetical protein